MLTEDIEMEAEDDANADTLSTKQRASSFVLMHTELASNLYSLLSAGLSTVQWRICIKITKLSPIHQ